MFNKIKKLTSIVFILTIPFKGKAQFAISNVDQIAKIKSGTTYVTKKDPASPVSKEYMDAIKQAWTISKIEFIKYADVEQHLSPENSFLIISGVEKNTTMMHTGANGLPTRGVSYTNVHIYLQLWVCEEKYFTRKKKKELSSSDQVEIARIELYPDFKTMSNPDNIYNSDYDGGGHIRNWGPGILKNYIQHLMVLLNDGKEKGLFKGLSTDELNKLKKETLFIPDYVLIKENKFTGDESGKYEEKEMCEDYKYKYKMLSAKELSDKIMKETTPFYYLIYVKSSTDKFVNVINSQTGEVIYADYVPVSYNFKSGDLKSLYKKINSDK
jgi:hypothetical protein